MRFALVNTVPPGFCRKMHILAPGGQLADLAKLRRDDLPTVGLSPTHMEAIQGFVEWEDRGLSPCLGLTMWYLESIQDGDGGFLRTEDAPSQSIGVANRFLQVAGQCGIDRDDYESVNRAAAWLEGQIDDDGLIRMPISGLVDFGMLARAIKALAGVAEGSSTPELERSATTLLDAQVGPSMWATYPNGDPSTGATSLAVDTIANLEPLFDFTPDPSWLVEAQNDDGGWGEFPGSPSRLDNSFWGLRACKSAGCVDEIKPVSSSLLEAAEGSYDLAMADRLLVLQDLPPSEDLKEQAMLSLTEDADRYAQTAIHALVLAEMSNSDQGSGVAIASTELPLSTPDFIRREPPLYDQLAEVSSRRWWLRVVEGASRRRLAEASIGWVAGLSAAIAMVGEELFNGLNALPLAALGALLFVQGLLVLGWLAARQDKRRKLNAIPHFLFAVLLASLLVILVTSPDDVNISIGPSVALALLLALIIEVIAVATDKVDLLSRLGDD